MTKEKIQAQIDVYNELGYHVFANSLMVELNQSKSIEDLQREAFEAGRTNCKDFIDEEEYEGNVHLRPCRVKYNTFEDYLKNLENG